MKIAKIINKLSSIQKFTLIAITALVYLVLLQGSAQAQENSWHLPWSSDFTPGTGGGSAYLVISDYSTVSGNSLDAKEVWLKVYMSQTAIDRANANNPADYVNVVLENPDFCQGVLPDSNRTIGVKYSVIRSTADERPSPNASNPLVLLDYYSQVDPSGGCGDRNFNGGPVRPAHFTRSNVEGHIDANGNQLYTLLIKAELLEDDPAYENGGVNGFKVKVPNGGIGYYDNGLGATAGQGTFTDVQLNSGAVAIQDRTGTASSLSTFKFRFAPSCDLTTARDAWLKWSDDDSGNGNNQNQRITVLLEEFDNAGNRSVLINELLPDDTPQNEFRQRKFKVNPGYKYEWTFSNVAKTNGVQIWMPFDSFTYFFNCQQPYDDGTTAISCSGITGTVYDNDDNDNSVTVDIHVDGVWYDRVTASPSFNWPIPISLKDQRDHKYDVWALNEPAGAHKKLKTRTIPCGSNPTGSAEISCSAITGSATDPEDQNGAVEIQIYSYSTTSWHIVYATPNFSYPIPANLKDGNNHGFDVWAINEPGNPNANTRIAQLNITCPPPGNDPIWDVERFGCDPNNVDRLLGWALDQDNLQTSTYLHLYIDGEYHAVIDANLEREDVGEVYNPDGEYNNYGFEYYMPDSIHDGNSHTITLYVKNIGQSGFKKIYDNQTIGPCPRSIWDLYPRTYSIPETQGSDLPELMAVVHRGSEITIIGDTENRGNVLRPQFGSGISPVHERLIKPDQDVIDAGYVTVTSVSEGGINSAYLQRKWVGLPALEPGIKDDGSSVAYRVNNDVPYDTILCFNTRIRPAWGYSTPTLSIVDNNYRLSNYQKCFKVEPAVFDNVPSVSVNNPDGEPDQEGNVKRGTTFEAVAEVTNVKHSTYETFGIHSWIRTFIDTSLSDSDLSEVVIREASGSVPNSQPEIGDDWIPGAGGGLTLTHAWEDEDGVAGGETDEWRGLYSVPPAAELYRAAGDPATDKFCVVSNVQEAAGTIGEPADPYRRDSDPACPGIYDTFDLHPDGGGSQVEPGDPVDFTIENRGGGPSAYSESNDDKNTRFRITKKGDPDDLIIDWTATESIAGAYATGEEGVPSGTYSGSFAIPDDLPIGQYCVTITVAPASGAVFANDGSDVEIADNVRSKDICYNVHEKPFITSSGADLWAGAVFADGGEDNPLRCSALPSLDELPDGSTFGSIVSVNANNENNGANTSLAAFGLNKISGFGTFGLDGLLRSADASLNNQLTFSNTNEDRLGFFTKQAHCLPDLYDIYRPEVFLDNSGDEIVLTDYSATIGDDPGLYVFRFKNRELLSSDITVKTGQKVILIFDPSDEASAPVKISGNIRFDYSASSPEEVPFFMVVAQDASMGVTGNVDQLDGLYVTEQYFSTCLDYDEGGVVRQYVGDVCDNQLVINGAIIADQLHLRRTFGGLIFKDSDENKPAEIINTFPEMFLGSPRGVSEYLSRERIDHALDLPPVYLSN